MRCFLGLSLILFFSIELGAQSLSGTWGYKIDGNQITLYGDKITNYDNAGSSGTLKIALCATNYPYSGGPINGYTLYEVQLDPLDVGNYYYDISKTGDCSYPPSNGSYYLTIVLLEYNYQYEIADYISMDGTASRGTSSTAFTGGTVDWSKVVPATTIMNDIMESIEKNNKRVADLKKRREEDLKKKQDIYKAKQACAKSGSSWNEELQLCIDFHNKRGIIYGDCQKRYGIYVYPEGNRYEGDWKNGKRHGNGIYTWINGDKYNGAWKNNKRNGKGTYTLDSGARYIGRWEDGKKQGRFTYISSTGDETKQKWKNGIKIN